MINQYFGTTLKKWLGRRNRCSVQYSMSDEADTSVISWYLMSTDIIILFNGYNYD